eukprot:317242-Hanusia_phi.AAC.2
MVTVTPPGCAAGYPIGPDHAVLLRLVRSGGPGRAPPVGPLRARPRPRARSRISEPGPPECHGDRRRRSVTAPVRRSLGVPYRVLSSSY